MTTDLRDALREHLDAVPAPPGDLGRVRARGRGLRRRRAAAVGAVAVLGVGVLVAGYASVQSGDHPAGRGIDPVGRLDFSGGLRAYAAPGAEIHLGGRTFPAARLDFLDTDAAATPYGVVFYDGGVPELLDESGHVTALEPGADQGAFHPTAKADAHAPLVAYGVTRDGRAEVVVRDLGADEVVARHEVADGTVIDGLDRGAVLLRTDDGTSVWDSGTDREKVLAGPRTRIADLRNGVLLYDGPAPDGPAAASYRLVKGAVDAQLTFDGRYVLSWSSRLASTDGGDPLVLDEGPTKGLGFWAIDTDGSVLVADPVKPYPHYVVHDCEVPSGTCAEVGPLVTEHGDPMFIGTDM